MPSVERRTRSLGGGERARFSMRGAGALMLLGRNPMPNFERRTPSASRAGDLRAGDRLRVTGRPLLSIGRRGGALTLLGRNPMPSVDRRTRWSSVMSATSSMISSIEGAAPLMLFGRNPMPSVDRRIRSASVMSATSSMISSIAGAAPLMLFGRNPMPRVDRRIRSASVMTGAPSSLISSMLERPPPRAGDAEPTMRLWFRKPKPSVDRRTRSLAISLGLSCASRRATGVRRERRKTGKIHLA